MSTRIHHISIFVNNMERSLQLFRDLLGMEEIQRLPGVRGSRISKLLGIAEFEAEMVFLKHPAQKVSLELVHQLSPPRVDRNTNKTGGFGLSFMVPDLGGIYKDLAREGWSPISEPLEMVDPAGRSIRLFCFPTDEGVMVELIEQAA